MKHSLKIFVYPSVSLEGLRTLKVKSKNSSARIKSSAAANDGLACFRS